MLSEEQVQKIIESHLKQSVETGLINDGWTEVAIFKIDLPRIIKWKGKPAWEIDFIYSTNVTVNEGMTSSSREYRYRKTLVLDEDETILHATKPKLMKHIQGPDFSLDL